MLALGLNLWSPAVLGRRSNNLLANPRWEGAVSGSPGTPPTGWTAPVAGGTLTAAPSGLGGNSLRFATAAARHFVQQSQTFLPSTTYCFSAIVDVTTASTVGESIGLSPALTGVTLAWRLNGVTAAFGTALPVGAGHLLEMLIPVGATGGTSGVRLGCGTSSAITADITFHVPVFEVGSARTVFGA